MFAAPPEQSLEWNDAGVEGAHRCLKRLWAFAVESAAVGDATPPTELAPAVQAARREVHETLRQAQVDFGKYQFNTVVSACMKILNTLGRLEDAAGAAELRREGLSILLRLLAPVAPHVTHHLWCELGFGDDIVDAPWPEVDEAALQRDSIELAVQVNGKLRGQIEVAADADQAAVETAALAEPNVARFIEGKTLRKIIVVPGRLVNVVAG
jgi:leucyl-tRNA synthetase